MDKLDGPGPFVTSTFHSNGYGSPGLLKRAESSYSAIIAGENQFGLNLYTIHSKISTDKSIIISPKSITTALQVLGFGAHDKTKDQIEEALGGLVLGKHYQAHHGSTTCHKSKDKKSRHLIKNFKGKILKKLSSTDVDALNQDKTASPYELVTKICIKKGMQVDKGYVNQAKELFGANTETMDFAGNVEKCREQINAWVKKQTHGHISAVVSKESVKPSTSMVLVNCIYFKGTWENKFEPDMTRERVFHGTTGDRKTSFMYNRDDFLYHESSELNCQVLEMPYVNKTISFVALLPRDQNGLARLEQNLTLENLDDVFTNVAVKPDLMVYMPKFSLCSDMELKDSFQECGISDLFAEDRANLRGIDSKGQLYVSGIAHKVFIEVNEEGCEAAAVTCEVVRSAGGGGPPPTIFDANHPFLFLIKENESNTILFLGKYCSPDV